MTVLEMALSKPQTLEERATAMLHSFDVVVCNALIQEIQSKIEDLSQRIMRSLEININQVRMFEDQSASQSSQMIDRTMLRKAQLRDEMMMRKERLCELKSLLGTWREASEA